MGLTKLFEKISDSIVLSEFLVRFRGRLCEMVYDVDDNVAVPCTKLLALLVQKGEIPVHDIQHVYEILTDDAATMRHAVADLVCALLKSNAKERVRNAIPNYFSLFYPDVFRRRCRRACRRLRWSDQHSLYISQETGTLRKSVTSLTASCCAEWRKVVRSCRNGMLDRRQRPFRRDLLSVERFRPKLHHATVRQVRPPLRHSFRRRSISMQTGGVKELASAVRVLAPGDGQGRGQPSQSHPSSTGHLCSASDR